MPDVAGVNVAAEVQYRNARLRAWRGVGMPVTGRWSYRGGPDGSDGYVRFDVHCTVCKIPFRASMPGLYYFHHLVSLWDSGLPVFLSKCPPLRPLAGGDPPAVVDLTALELLAGE